MITDRQYSIDEFYRLLDMVIIKFPRQSLSNLSSMHLPEKGVYFFFENGETRDDKVMNRVVRIGTHAALAKSKATLYDRLHNHKGSNDLTGNHRGSVFRKLIGFSLINRDNLEFNYWGDKSKIGDRPTGYSEKPVEIKVSEYLNSMTFTVLEVPGDSSKDNDRALIEENAIALLSNYEKIRIDKCSSNWLGLYSKDKKVMSSGLWNSKHVNQINLDVRFFKTFQYHLTKMNG